jgi:hypothetical protein
VTRSRKIEKEIKESFEFRAIGVDYEGHNITEYTNEGSDAFCPYIDNKKLAKVILAGHGEGDVHKDYPAKLHYSEPGRDNITQMNQKNRHFHVVQLKNWSTVQFCKLQKDPERDFEKCEWGFRKCPVYIAAMAEEKKAKKRVV